jgi:hypothetical protein
MALSIIQSMFTRNSLQEVYSVVKLSLFSPPPQKKKPLHLEDAENERRDDKKGEENLFFRLRHAE